MISRKHFARFLFNKLTSHNKQKCMSQKSVNVFKQYNNVKHVEGVKAKNIQKRVKV